MQNSAPAGRERAGEAGGRRASRAVRARAAGGRPGGLALDADRGGVAAAGGGRRPGAPVRAGRGDATGRVASARPYTHRPGRALTRPAPHEGRAWPPSSTGASRLPLALPHPVGQARVSTPSPGSGGCSRSAGSRGWSTRCGHSCSSATSGAGTWPPWAISCSAPCAMRPSSRCRSPWSWASRVRDGSTPWLMRGLILLALDQLSQARPGLRARVRVHGARSGRQPVPVRHAARAFPRPAHPCDEPADDRWRVGAVGWPGRRRLAATTRDCWRPS